jgi:hypothetical protein
MANGVVAGFAAFLMAAAVLTVVVVVFRRRTTQPELPAKVAQIRPVAERAQALPLRPMPAAEGREAPPPVLMKTVSSNNASDAEMKAPRLSTAPMPVPILDIQGVLATQGDRNERILAGISENIRKSLEKRPVPQNSPLQFSESNPRNTEYVRVKKEIITPHGQIRFSILKDWMSTNMLAIFRRASLDWKTPDDLVAFLPAYLKPEAEIINGEVLVIGTPGHNEKLAVPLRNLGAASSLRDCFDFVTDIRKGSNTPAVLLTSDAGLEVVSKGVITQALFMNAIEQGHGEVTLFLERSTQGLQKSYHEALQRMESTVAADAI